jgi:hypothetical protein
MPKNQHLLLDINLSENTNIAKLKRQLGYAGFGLYIELLLLLAKNNDVLSINYNDLAFQLRAKQEYLKLVIESFDLFNINNNTFTSKIFIQKTTKKSTNSKQTINSENDTFIEEIKIKIFPCFNNTMNTKCKSYQGFLTNYIFWRNDYSVDEILEAIVNIPKDEFWKDKMTLEVLFRRFNPNKETVNYIEKLLSLKVTNNTPKEDYEENIPAAPAIPLENNLFQKINKLFQK